MALLKPPVGPRDHSLGSVNAPVTLVEYGDFECPFCGRSYPELKQVLRQLGSKVQFVFRHFPLSEEHPRAQHAAEVAEAAAAQGKFWEMHDLLYQRQGALAGEGSVGFVGGARGVRRGWGTCSGPWGGSRGRWGHRGEP